MTGKLGLDSIKDQAIAVASDEAAQAFVKGAKSISEELDDSSVSSVSSAPKRENSSKKKRRKSTRKKIEPKLIVQGQLKNRTATCNKPIQLYVLNENMKWMDTFASTGKGGKQILINYLIKRGIQSVEEEFEKHGLIFADEEPEEDFEDEEN